jgi:trans-2,3-dihydro-3-hydroxyanthranilate isomerase
MSAVAYVTVDVFTPIRFGGNPLAVMPDARGLDDATMQRIAAEFNFSESTFVLPPADPDHTARVRIFTPTNEVPFAGHPNVGTAYALARQGTVFGRPVGETMRFEERAGLVEVAALRDADRIVGPRIQAPKPLATGPAVEVGVAAACASLAAADIVTAAHAPVIASVGLPFALAEVASLTALARAEPNVAAFKEAEARYRHPDDAFALLVYVPVSADPWRVRARMFAPLSNTFEDPATGSAAAALGALLASFRPESDGEFDLEIEQGVEMGRPSLIQVNARKADGAVTTVTIAGRCVSVMKGTIETDIQP